MDIKELYKLWCDSAVDDSDLQRELEDIKNDDEAINDRFYRELEFGTGGLRYSRTRLGLSFPVS